MHQIKQRKSWAYCTIDFTNMLTNKFFANYIYPLYGPTWNQYAAPVWDPHLRKDQDLLESTQKFTCKMMTKTWDRGYDELLNMTNLPSLTDRTLQLKLCSLYKIVYDLSYFPPYIVVPKVTRSYILAHPLPCISLFCTLIVTLLSLMLYNIGTLFKNWLFLPLPSHATFKLSLKQYCYMY